MEKFLLYKNELNEVKIEVLLENETLWLSQKAIANLFQVGIPAIAKHIRNIYECGELNEESTVSKMERVKNEGNRKVKRNQMFLLLKII